MNKINKYLHYVNVFLKSSEKKALTKDLVKEIRHKGLKQGVQSYLHLKAAYFFPGYDLNYDFEPILSVGRKQKELEVAIPMAVEPLVSVIISMQNEAEHVYYCIRSLMEKGAGDSFEVIIADKEDSEKVGFLSDYVKNLVVVTTSGATGVPAMMNAAAAKARGKYLLFLNYDVLVKKGLLTEMTDVYERFENVAVVGSKHLNPDGTLREAGGIIWNDGSSTGYGDGDVPRKAEYNFVREVDFVSYSSMMLTHDMWKSLKGFDEQYQDLEYAGKDICFAAARMGGKVMYQPVSSVVHYESKANISYHTSEPDKVINNDLKRFREKWKAELALKSKKKKSTFTERQRPAERGYILVVDQNLPDLSNKKSSRWGMDTMTRLVTAMGYKLVFICTYDQQSQSGIEALQKQGVEVLTGDRRDYVNRHMHHFAAVLFGKVSAAIPYLILLRNNNYKGTVINCGQGLTHIRVDQESVAGRDLTFDYEARLLKAQEDFVYSHADHSLLSNWNEIRYLRTYISKQLHYVPQFQYKSNGDQPGFSLRDGVVFYGDGLKMQDLDALRWLLEKVYKPLAEKDIKLTVVCANTPSFIFDFKNQYKKLEILSDISADALRDQYRSSKVFLAPMRVGSGMSGRLPEVFACGLPVAGTFLAYEGIPEDDRLTYNVYNTAEELSAEVLKLCTDEGYWNRLSETGTAYVGRNFNTDTAETILKAILDK